MSHVLSYYRGRILALNDTVKRMSERLRELGTERNYYKKLVKAQQKELDFWRNKDGKN